MGRKSSLFRTFPSRSQNYSTCLNNTARQAAAKRSNYSITAGKRSAPAERNRKDKWAPRGFNTGEDVTQHGQATSSPYVRPRGRSTPLGPSAPPHARCYHAITRHTARHVPHGPPRGKNVVAGLTPRAFSGGRNAAPPKATALAIGCPRKRLRKCPTAVCAIWQTVKADARVRPPFSVGKAAGRGPFVDPSHGFRFPSHGSADPSHGNFVPWALFDRKMALIFAI